MKRVVIAGSCRTPLGKAPGGRLKDVSAPDLLVACFKETIKRCGFENQNFPIDEVIIGNVAQSSDAPNVARVVALKAGLPERVSAFTVQRNCGSGLQSLVSAAQMIKAGDAAVILVGGTESMSNIPYVLRGMRNGIRYFPGKGKPMSNLVDALDEGLTDPVTGELMGKTAENVAREYKISRVEQDEFAVRSHKEAFKALRSGKFRSQIVSIKTKDGLVSEDEGINPALNKEMMAMAPTIFKENGTVTPLNSCPLSDGASSFLVLSEEAAGQLGIKPEAEIISYAFAGLNPSYMGMGPFYAIPAVLKKSGLTMGNIDFWEINEAFAAQALACQYQLGIRLEYLNVWGGAIALGHPVGATGAILTAKMIAILKDANKDLGVVSMCIGGGQGGALAIRNWKQ